MKYRPKTKPFPHQAKATLAAVRKRNFGIFFEPRLGKSKAALDAAGIHAMRHSRNLRVLILAPRIAIDVWEDQLEKHFPFPYFAETFDEEWTSDKHMGLKFKVPDGLVYTPRFFLAGREETFVRHKVLAGTTVKYRAAKHGEDADWDYYRPKQKILEAWDPDIIIVDESHEYKRPGGVGGQDLWRLVRRLRKARSNGMPFVIELSGTPNPKGYVDLFSQFRIMDENIFGTNFGDYKEEYLIYGHGKRKWTVVGHKNEADLLKKVREHSISVAADQVGMANKQFFQLLRVELPPQVKRMYLELAEEFITEWEGGTLSAANAGVKRMRLLQLTGGFTTEGQQIHDAKVAKLKAYVELLLEQGESVVVYSRFTPEVRAAFQVLQDVGFDAFRVDGSTSRPDRREAIQSLRERPKTPTAISFQHQAGSRSIELVGAAETVYYSTPDGWVDYFQTKNRTLGPNQKRPVRYTHLIAPGTVDIRTIRNLEAREDGHATMMDNPRRYLYGLV